MSRRSLAPLLFAAATGVVSGVYIFKPLLEERKAELEAQKATEAEVKQPMAGPAYATTATAATAVPQAASEASLPVTTSPKTDSVSQLPVKKVEPKP